MSTMEIFLLIAGGIIFIVSFFLPAGGEDKPGERKALVKEEIKGVVYDEMGGIRSRMEAAVEETISGAMEKTKRSLERISNEKIMAVNEYSDNVLEEIHKNQQEVMFLYDMLIDKHKNLKDTVSEMNRTIKEAEETKREAQAIINSFQSLAPKETKSEGLELVLESEALESVHLSEESMGAAMDSSHQREATKESNSNDRILELYKEGWSKVAIAKELGLGVGEVKLVVDLYKNM